MILAGTGHRDLNLEVMKRRTTAILLELQPAAVIQGCASGFDLWLGKISIDLNIPVISAKPWTTHKPRIVDRELYNYVLRRSDEVYPVVEADTYPGVWVYGKRNEWMIDECDEVLAWWSGYEGGGTYDAIKYARKVGKPIRNIYAEA